MFNLNWSDPDTFWLNVTNIGLGLVVLICVAVIAGSIVKEALARRKARATEPAEVASLGGHAFHVPGLGLTMADGGEEEPPSKTAPPRKSGN